MLRLPSKIKRRRTVLLPALAAWMAATVACAQPAFVAVSPQARTPATLTSPPLRVADHLDGDRVHWSRVGQCQVALEVQIDPNSGLSRAADPRALEHQVDQCVARALAEGVRLLILPELALATDVDTRHRIQRTLAETAKSHDMIVVAGSYYDENRFSRLVVIGPGWVEEGYKIRPSRFEVSPRSGLGMRDGRHLLVVNTKYGRIAPITCVDLISDDVQYILRRLATQGQVDLVVNINWNPSAWEFLIEANSLVRRHPVFVTITNTVPAKVPSECVSGGKNRDTGSCFGHTAVFADLRSKATDAPNNIQSVVGQLPTELVSDGKPSLPFDHLAGDVGAFGEGLLVYELNLYMPREPGTTNAPDQGYPTIRDIHVANL